ncbi:hypothetical protein KM043_016373 [Ampulex compressa]|nr:hypothetical protein KM043_016373 [Ampulex compressa]
MLKRSKLFSGQKFFSKGEYYAHCEKLHPHTRTNAIISRNKYKITGEDILVRCKRYFRKKTEQKYRISRYSKRLSDKKQQIFSSEFKLNSLTYDERSIEDVPLIYFLYDKRFKKLQRKQARKGEDRISNSEMKTEHSGSKDPQEEGTSKFFEECLQEACISCPIATSTCTELPTKKLILQRFMANVKSEVIIPLQEKNNNDYNQANFQDQEELSGRNWASRERPTNVKSSWKRDKENMPDCIHRCKEEINIRLDSEITVPFVTEMHRDFLSSIDFDEFRTY